MDLQAIFGGNVAPVTAPVVISAPAPESAPAGTGGASEVAVPADVLADVEALAPFLNWVRRPDCHGRMGWEAPDLPEAARWWAWFDFADLPEVPEGFAIGDTAKPALQDRAGCVPGGRVDTLDLDSKRPSQGQLRGFGGE